MPNYNYFPILKTTDAELKAFSNLNSTVKNNILPIFELTKSRRSKKNQDADIWKRIKTLKTQLDNNPFILDLTTEATLSNGQIDRMLKLHQNGFIEWVSFIQELNKEKLTVIPVIHYNPNTTEEVIKEIKSLSKISSNLAFRVDVSEEDLISYLDIINSAFDLSMLILILDGRFIRIDSDSDEGDKSQRFINVLNKLTRFKTKATICAFSSFPASVVDNGYGKDQDGRFPIAENITYDILKKNNNNIFHGDYGSVHPFRYETAGGTWIPRIDFSTDFKFYYHRYRRGDGGYIKAAKKVINDQNYQIIKDFPSWGDEEIALAAEETPRGLSPSHWIAVRVNLFISKQYLRLKRDPQMSL